MSPVAGERVPWPSEGPSLKARICALGVVLALAALAAYTVFSGPTKVTIKTSTPAPTQSAPQAPQQEPEGEGATSGD